MRCGAVRCGRAAVRCALARRALRSAPGARAPGARIRARPSLCLRWVSRHCATRRCAASLVGWGGAAVFCCSPCSFTQCPTPRDSLGSCWRSLGDPLGIKKNFLFCGGITCLTPLVLTASFVLFALRSVKDHHHSLLHYSPLLKNTCVRQVVLDKRFPPELCPPNSASPSSRRARKRSSTRGSSRFLTVFQLSFGPGRVQHRSARQEGPCRKHNRV